MGSEDTAVRVALVDDDVAQAAQEAGEVPVSGQERAVELVAFAGARVVYGFTGAVMGPLERALEIPRQSSAKPADRGAKR